MLVEKVDKKIDGSLILKTPRVIELKNKYPEEKQTGNGFGTYKLKPMVFQNYYYLLLLRNTYNV